MIEGCHNAVTNTNVCDFYRVCAGVQLSDAFVLASVYNVLVSSKINYRLLLQPKTDRI